MTHAAIIVPGIMGSVLELNGEVIWPGSKLDLILPYKKMAKLLQPNLVATDLIRSFSISEQYQKLIDDLNRCGFREEDDPKTLYVLPYDWRKDNALAAGKLADLIDKAVTENGATEVSLIGHSMGGLVSRYYLESGDFQSRRGFGAIKRLITLGTPHRGAPLALSAAMGKEKRLFLNKDQVQLLGNDPRYPALYQLLPPPGEPFAWSEEQAAEYAEVDIYDPAMATALGLEPQNLQAAKLFHSKLDLNKRPKVQGKLLRYFFFVGTGQRTNSSVSVLPIGQAQFQVTKMERDNGGDGTVPAWSALMTGIQGQPVGGEHSTLYKNDPLRRTMATLLGAPGVLAGATNRVEVALRERVVHTGDTVHVALTFGATVDKLDGRLVVQLTKLDDDGNLIGTQPMPLPPISYSGLNAERLHVIFNAPGFPGIYRVSYLPSDRTEPAGSDELIVQSD